MPSAKDQEGRSPLRVGQVFADRYVIEGLIGRGGQSWVYRAHHIYTGADVALKLIHRDGGISDDTFRRGQSEARIQRLVQHPAIARVEDAGLTPDRQLYLVMELMPGRSLRSVLQEHRTLAVHEVLSLGLQVAEGMHAAHEYQIVHRDLKPENLFINPGNRVKIIDFGIAKLLERSPLITQKDMIVGTLQYMSPEQFQARPLTPRSDIYALGLILYEALLGQQLVEWLLRGRSRDMYEIGRIIVKEKAPLLHEIKGMEAAVPPYVSALVNQCLAKADHQRFQSMAQLAEAFRVCLKRYAEQQRAEELVSRELWRPSATESGRVAKVPAPPDHTGEPPMLAPPSADPPPSNDDSEVSSTIGPTLESAPSEPPAPAAQPPSERSERAAERLERTPDRFEPAAGSDVPAASFRASSAAGVAATTRVAIPWSALSPKARLARFRLKSALGRLAGKLSLWHFGLLGVAFGAVLCVIAAPYVVPEWISSPGGSTHAARPAVDAPNRAAVVQAGVGAPNDARAAEHAREEPASDATTPPSAEEPASAAGPPAEGEPPGAVDGRQLVAGPARRPRADGRPAKGAASRVIHAKPISSSSTTVEDEDIERMRRRIRRLWNDVGEPPSAAPGSGAPSAAPSARAAKRRGGSRDGSERRPPRAGNSVTDER